MTYNGVTNTFGGDNNYAIDAYFNGTAGVAIDAAGNVYLADTGNNRIRMMKNVNNCINTPVTINGVSKPHGCNVITIAGGGIAPQVGTTGGNCGATTGTRRAPACRTETTPSVTAAPRFWRPSTALLESRLLPMAPTIYVAQNTNHRIRKIDMNTGLISTRDRQLHRRHQPGGRALHRAVIFGSATSSCQRDQHLG